jgi:hypothetical protein
MIIAAVIIVAMIVVIGLVRAGSPDVQAKQRRTCTKHVIRTSSWGPDRMVWQYGPHRTPGQSVRRARAQARKYLAIGGKS